MEQQERINPSHSLDRLQSSDMELRSIGRDESNHFLPEVRRSRTLLPADLPGSAAPKLAASWQFETGQLFCLDATNC